MTEEQIPQEERKFIKNMLEMGIASTLKAIQSSHVFNLENEVKKLYSLFFTIEQDKIDRDYILEKITQLIVRRPLNLSYEGTLLSYCLSRDLINHHPHDKNLLAVCEKAVRKEGVVNFKPIDKINEFPESGESND